MSTAIARWGNSSAVRIPAKILSQSGRMIGDLVEPVVNQRGNIELVSAVPAHRKVKAPGRITSEELYEKYPAEEAYSTDGWPSDDMVGAEWESWAR